MAAHLTRRRAGTGLLAAVIAAGLLALGVMSLLTCFSGVVTQTANDELRLRMEHMALDLMELLKARTGPELEKLLPLGDTVPGLHQKFSAKEGLEEAGKLDTHEGQHLTVSTRGRLEKLSDELVGLTLTVEWVLGANGRSGKIELARIVRRTW